MVKSYNFSPTNLVNTPGFPNLMYQLDCVILVRSE